MSTIPPDEIQEVAARKLYALIGRLNTDAESVSWEQLPQQTRELLYKAAAVAGAATPAPIVVRCEHAAPFPLTGIQKYIYASNTKESIDAATEQFRSFLTMLSEEWTERHEEPMPHG